MHLPSMITKWWRNNLTIPVNDGSSNQNDYHHDTKTNGNYLRHRCKKNKNLLYYELSWTCKIKILTARGARGTFVQGYVQHLTNRFRVTVCMFSNRSQMTSNCGKNNKGTNEAQPFVSLMFSPRFAVFCDLLLNRPTATWNLFVSCDK